MLLFADRKLVDSDCSLICELMWSCLSSIDTNQRTRIVRQYFSTEDLLILRKLVHPKALASLLKIEALLYPQL